MPLLPYDYLHLVNCPEVVTISDNYCNDSGIAKTVTVDDCHCYRCHSNFFDLDL